MFYNPLCVQIPHQRPHPIAADYGANADILQYGRDQDCAIVRERSEAIDIILEHIPEPFQFVVVQASVQRMKLQDATTVLHRLD